jgi:hypothetical protein
MRSVHALSFEHAESEAGDVWFPAQPEIYGIESQLAVTWLRSGEASFMTKFSAWLPAVFLYGLLPWQCGSLSAAAQVREFPRLAIPGYVSPSSSDWDVWSSLGPRAVGIMVLNRNNGDDISDDPGVALRVKATQKSGILVLGYVHTGYARRDPDEVRAKIDGVYRAYHVDGIFFDETPTDCSATGYGGATTLTYFQALSRYIRGKPGKHLVVLNPGTMPPTDCWMSAADILVTFEAATLSKYESRYGDASWNHAYSPMRFWNLVYSVPTVAEMNRAVDLARERGVGWLYITDDGPDGNPWDQPASYLQAEATSWTGVQTPANVVHRRVSLQWGGMHAARTQIFIATGEKHVPLYRASGVGMPFDLLLQMPGDGSVQLLRYSGDGDDWQWTEVQAHAVLSQPQPGTTRVEFDADPLGSATSFHIQFRLLDKDWNARSQSKVFVWKPR